VKIKFQFHVRACINIAPGRRVVVTFVEQALVAVKRTRKQMGIVRSWYVYEGSPSEAAGEGRSHDFDVH